jgi:hypothetical protein
MSGESPVVELYDVNGNPLAVQNGVAIPASTPALMVAGSDGTNSRYITIDGSGHPVIVGAGVAGTPSGGVVSIQGVTSGTVVPISGTVTSNIGTTGGLALDTTVSGLQVSQGSTTSGQKGGLTLGAVTTSAPAYTTAQTSPLSLTTAGALRIDGSAVTQPISGTVTANIGTTNGLALDTSVNGILVAQGSTTSGEKGPLIQGAVTTSAPAYTTAQTSPLSLTTAGALRIDGSAVTQPVSGTVTSNQGTANSLANAWSTKITDTTNGPAAVKAASTAAVATDQALVVAISPNNSVGVSVSSGAADTTASGSLGALNANVQIALTGLSGVGMLLAAGTLIGTIVPEVSMDGGTTWVSNFFADATTGNRVSSIVFASSNTVTTRTILAAAGASHARVRVSAFTSGTATCNLRATIFQNTSLLSEGVTNTSIIPPTSILTSAISYGVTRNPRVDRFGHVRNAVETLLFFDSVEDRLSASINPLIWSTNTSNMTVNQSSSISAGITLNNGSSAAASAFAIISSNKFFQIMNHGPIKVSFRAQFIQSSTNSVLELGIGKPTNGRLQPQLVDGAFFRFNSSQASSAIFTTSSTDQSTIITPTLSTSQYYNFIIYVDETSAQFIIESTPGVPIFNTSFTVPVGDGAQFSTNHLPVFARVYNLSSAPASAPQILIRQVTATVMDLSTNKSWEHQSSSSGKLFTFDPVAFTSTSNLAAAAGPTAGTPSNTAALFTSLGGEYICNATVTSENLLSVFAYTIPTNYSFNLTDIFIPAPVVQGAATATTATNIQFAVVANCGSTNINTGGGQLFTIPGTFVAASGTAIGASFSGNTCIFTPKTPIVCNPGSVLHIAYKIYLGTATASSKYRGSVTVVGYFE